MSRKKADEAKSYKGGFNQEASGYQKNPTGEKKGGNWGMCIHTCTQKFYWVLIM